MRISFTKPKREVSKVFIHCSASDRPEDDNVQTIKKWHIARGFSDIGYHYYINKKGICFNGRPIEQIPAAQKGHNTGSIAICLGGLTGFTTMQFDMLKALCISINEVYAGAVTFHGHREVNPNKTCPNFDYIKLLNLSPTGELPRSSSSPAAGNSLADRSCEDDSAHD